MISKTSRIIALNILLLTYHPWTILSAPLNQMLQPLPLMPFGYFPYTMYPQYPNFPSTNENIYKHNNNLLEDNNSIEIENPVNIMSKQNIDPVTNPIGSLIMLIPFLPIHINVPDTINTVSAAIQAILGTVGQRIPFVSNWFPAITAMPQQGPAAPFLATRNLFTGQSEQNNIVQPPMIFLVPFNSRQVRDVKLISA